VPLLALPEVVTVSRAQQLGVRQRRPDGNEIRDDPSGLTGGRPGRWMSRPRPRFPASSACGLASCRPTCPRRARGGHWYRRRSCPQRRGSPRHHSVARTFYGSSREQEGVRIYGRLATDVRGRVSADAAGPPSGIVTFRAATVGRHTQGSVAHIDREYGDHAPQLDTGAVVRCRLVVRSASPAAAHGGVLLVA
jgi:hypothetical protein